MGDITKGYRASPFYQLYQSLSSVPRNPSFLLYRPDNLTRKVSLTEEEVGMFLRVLTQQGLVKVSTRPVPVSGASEVFYNLTKEGMAISRSALEKLILDCEATIRLQKEHSDAVMQERILVQNSGLEPKTSRERVETGRRKVAG